MSKKPTKKQLKEQWWDKNYSRLIDYCSNTPFAYEMAGIEKEDDIQAFLDSTAKHQAIWMHAVMDIKDLNELLEDYENEDDED